MERPDLEGMRSTALGTSEYAGMMEGDPVVNVIDYALSLEQKLQGLTNKNDALRANSYNERIAYLEAAREFLEQKLERITSRLEEIEKGAEESLANSELHPEVHKAQMTARQIAQELLKELNK